MDVAGRSPPMSASPPAGPPLAAASPSSFSFINYFWPSKEIVGQLLINATIGSGKKVSIQVGKNDVSNILHLIAKEVRGSAGDGAPVSAPSSGIEFSQHEDQFEMEVEDDASLTSEARALLEMGFSHSSVKEALEKFQNDSQASIEWLLSTQQQIGDDAIAKTLTKLQIASLPPNDLKFTRDLPVFFASLQNIRHLSLEKHEFSTLPDLSACENLEELHMKDNKMKTIGDGVAKLKKLRVLALSTNYISALPNSIGQLTGLVELDLSNNYLAALPDAIKSMDSLSRLDLRQNRFIELPSVIFALPKLKSAFLDNNLMKTVPTSFMGVPQSLNTLSFAGNKIGWIPDPFFLAVEHCAKTLDFTGNPLLHVSAELGRLRRLKRLILKDCKLEALPATLSFCTELEHLDASNNPSLATLPPEMHNLTSLAWLDVSECALTTSTLQNLFTSQPNPSDSGKSFRIKTLRLSGNKFAGGIPESFGMQLSHCLESLELSRCEIVSLPDSLCLLSHLSLLDISKNNLAALPANFGQLASLTDLNVDLNAPLKDIPATFGNLTKLHHLSIANIRISRDSFGTKKAEIIDEKLQKFSRLIRMCLSSGGHPDLIFAMRYLATKPKYLKKMADRGVTQKLLRLAAVTMADKHVQEAALSTLLTLASVPENRQRLCDEPGLFNMCCDLIGAPSEDHVDRLKLIACDIICYIAFEDQQRYKIMQHHPQILSVLRKQLDRSHESIALVHHAQRALSALGDPFVLDKFSRKPLSGAFSRQEKDGIRVICIDGGGTRGYVTVLFLAHVEKALGRKICELFDLIVGTSTGSIIASLAMQGISMEQMMPLYRDLSRRAFVPYGAKVADMGPISVPRGSLVSFAHAAPVSSAMSPSSPETKDYPNLPSSPLANAGILARSPPVSDESPLDANLPFNLNTALGKGPIVPPATGASSISSYLLGGTMERLVSMTNVLRSKGYYSTKPFVKVLKDLAGGKTVRLIDTAVTSQIKLAILSCECSKVPVETFVFRNYAFPSAERSSRYRGDCEALLWQAMRASSAAPGYYDEFYLGNNKFIDGGVGANNPSAVAYHEARRLWPDRPLDLLLSCGNGIAPSKKNENTLSQLMLNIIDVATETEKTATLISNFLDDNQYIRIQPVDPAFDWSLDECRPEKFDTLEVAVDKFVAANSTVIRRICEKLAGVRAPPSPTL